MIPRLLTAGLVLCRLTQATVVTYNWAVTWVNVNPDGRALRPAIGINGQWPCPSIKVNVGDQVIVNVQNQLGNETTGIHWHGINQNGTNAMDGPTSVTQCPIPPGGSFTYAFTINQPGTYWYHSHNRGQYPDGLRGPIIVHDPNSPYAGQYSDELVMSVTDWYHDQQPVLIPYYLSPTQDEDGAEPVPYSGLLNEAQNIQFQVTPSTTYLLRVVNMAAFSQMFVHFDQHTLTIVEVDGTYTQPKVVDSLYLAVGQRYSVLLTTKGNTKHNYGVLGVLDASCFDDTPDYLNTNVSGTLIYNSNAPIPPPLVVKSFNVIDDITLVPYDNAPLLTGPFHQIVLNLSFFEQDNQNRAGFNGVTYIEQQVPSLFSAMSTGSDAANPVVYGANANAFVVPFGAVVELVVYNYDDGPHPMHIHGHQPQLVYRSPAGAGPDPEPYNPATVKFAKSPVRRDTWILQASGVTVVRFVADNPGVWLMHCHMEWHVNAGLTATLIEAPEQLQAQQTIPSAATELCKSQKIPHSGNAAGNTKNYTDLTGATTTCPPNPQGALVSSSKAKGSKRAVNYVR